VNRPLLVVALGFTAGLYLISQAQARDLAPGLLLSLFTLIIAIAVIRRRIPYAQHLLTALLAAFAATAVWNSNEQSAEGDPLHAAALDVGRTRVTLEAEVLTTDVRLAETDYLRFTAAAVARAPVSMQGAAGHVLVRWTEPAFTVYPGDRLRLEGRLDPSLGTVNFGLSGQEETWRRRGVHSVLRVRGEDVQRRQSNPAALTHWIGRLRQWEADQFAQIVPESVLPFVLTVWLGERSHFTEPTHDFYIASGTAHILAVSGIHVAIVYASIGQFLRLFIRHRRLRTALIMFSVIAFAFLAGARLPSLRAAAMFAIYSIAALLDREPDAPNALSIAALILLLITPPLIYDAGFLLSFASVASILLFSEPIQNRLTALPYAARSALAPTLAVQLLPLPLALHFFHVMPLLAPLANLLVIPLLTVVLWLCVLALAASAISMSAGFLLGHALYPFIESIRAIAGFVADLPLSHLRIVSPTALAAVLVWAAAAFLLWSLYAPNRRRILAALICCFGAWICWRDWRPPPSIDFLDVGSGDSIFLRTAGGATMLIDGGMENEYTSTGKWIVERFLYAQGVDELDYVVVTHPDGDHIGGLFHILRRFPVGTVLMGATETKRASEQAFLALCQERGVPVRRLARGDVLHLDGPSAQEGRLEVVHPPADWPAKPVNDTSLAFRLHWQGRRVLFTGDIEAPAEASLLPLQSALRADLLKVPHHGSHTSSTPAFLEAVQPDLAFVSTRATGKEAIAPVVQAEYRSQGIPLWRTDVHGGIRLRVQDGQLEISTARGEKALPPGAPPEK
jgi:competence protein ComEC